MLVSIGMTLVIATGGIDLSVGAVIAISAAMGAVLINPALGDKLYTADILTANTTNTPLAFDRSGYAGSGDRLWSLERFPGF
jgi:galactofuranose transport system permease protein